MEWFYANDDDREGPVSAKDLLDLEEQSRIIDSTLVWNETLPDWKSYARAKLEVMADALATEPELVQCVISGKIVHRDAALEYGEDYVLPTHKEELVQRLAEGGTIAAPVAPDDYGNYLNLSTVLRRTKDICSTHWLLLVLIHITVWIPMDQISALADATIYNGDDLTNARQSINLTRLLNSFGGIIAIAAIYRLCIYHSENTVPTYKTCMSEGLSLWGKFWVTRFIQGIFLFGGLLLLILPIIFAITSSGGGSEVLIGIMVLVLVPLLVWYLCRIAFTLPYIAETGVSGMPAIKKSFALSKGRIWQIIGYYLVIFAILVIPLFLPLVPTAFIPTELFFIHGLLTTVSGIVGTVGLVFAFCYYKQIRVSIGEDGLSE